MIFNIDIDYRRNLEQEKKMAAAVQGLFLENPELTLNYIEAALNQKFPQGLPRTERKIYERFLRKADQASDALVMDGKKYEIDLEAAELDLIKTAFAEAKWRPGLCKYIGILEAELEKL